MTVQDLISDAYCDTGATAPGETPESTELDRGLRILNQILSSRSLERDFVYTAKHETFALVANINSYTMGSGGSWSTTARPVRITGAMAYSGKFQQGVAVMNMEKFTQAIANNAGLTATLPQQMGVDTGAPLLTIRVFPTPNDSAFIEVHSWQPLTAFALLSDTVTFPVPGYEAALRSELAATLAPGLGRPVTVEMAGNMNRFNQRVVNLNASVEETPQPQPQQGKQ